MTLPRAIFFDLDDTIISAYAHPERAWDAVLPEFEREMAGLGVAAFKEAAILASLELWSDPEQHRIWRLKMRAARHEIVLRAFTILGHDDPGLATRIGDSLTKYRIREMHLFPGALKTIDALRRAGVGLALVTNGAPDMQRPKIERFDLEHRFDHIQIEGEFGAGKPEPEVYDNLLRVFDVAPDEAWMVGDNLEWEVAAPQRHGIYAIWCDAHGHGLPDESPIRPDRIINGLPELLEGHRSVGK